MEIRLAGWINVPDIYVDSPPIQPLTLLDRPETVHPRISYLAILEQVQVGPSKYSSALNKNNPIE